MMHFQFKMMFFFQGAQGLSCTSSTAVAPKDAVAKPCGGDDVAVSALPVCTKGRIRFEVFSLGYMLHAEQ